MRNVVRIAWGGGRYKLARSAMREQGRSKTGIASLRHVKLSPTSTPGLPGERQEHLDAIVSFAGAGQRRRLLRGLDILTIPTSKQFDDDEWIRSLTEAQEVTTDVPEDSVTYDQQDVDTQKIGPFRWESSFGNTSRGDSWLSVTENLHAALTTSMRQIGVGTPGGAEASTTFNQLHHDEWMTGSISGPLARIKVNEKNCFGMIEWKAVREAASRFLPKHAAAASWKHRNLANAAMGSSSAAWPWGWWWQKREEG